MDKFEEDEMAVVAEVEDSEAGEVGAAATTAAKCGDAVDKSSPVADLEEEEEIVDTDDSLAATNSVVVLCFVGPKQRVTELISFISRNPSGFCDVDDL